VSVTVRGYMDCVCCECVELCIEVVADYLGAEWNERVLSWKTKSKESSGP